MEAFLLKAEVTNRRDAGGGVTDSRAPRCPTGS